ncbi:restriction endonuclease subunit S [Pseudomonas sp. 3HC3]|uniref:restriction endonuclease subunit S n=1 Tax=Pseudomonas sp. 3HC3 TaxID=2781025 RepID=UPI00384460ED
MATLDNVCSIQSGGTPNRGTESYWGGSIPWAKISDLEGSGNGYISDTDEYISEEGLEAIRGRIFDDGTLLFAMYGSVGKSAIVRGSISTNQAILGIKPDASRLDLNYLKFWLRSQQPKFDRDAQGVAQKNLSAGYVRSLEIPLPPLPEQKRIAAILDKADAIRRKRQQAIQLADDFLRAVFLDMFGDPVTNPMGWEVRSIDDLCSEIVDCVNRTAPTVAYLTPYKMIRTTNVRNYTLDTNNVRYVDEETYKNWVRRLTPEVGDIVFTREAPAGEAAVIRTEDKIFLGQRTMLFRPIYMLISSDYLLFELMGSGVRTQINKMHSGSTVTHLSVPECKKFKIRVPPLELQRKFESIKKAVLRVRALGAGALDASLFESVSQKAFSGLQ